MESDESAEAFSDFIRRVQAGDPIAAEELVRKYERLIRREIRMNLLDERLRRSFDTVDFSQSILASFFLRVRADEYQLTKPADLIALLLTMTRNKVASSSRRVLAQKRDAKRSFLDTANYENRADAQATPSQIVSINELLEKAQAALSEEERLAFNLRQAGKSWEEVAEILGGTAQARRMQLTRALERVTELLGEPLD